MSAPRRIGEVIDIRLVAPAGGSWLVSAAGIVWPRWAMVVTTLAALGGAAALAMAGVARHRSRGNLACMPGRGEPPSRPVGQPALGRWVTVAGICATVAAFGCAIAVREHAAATHPLTAQFGHKTSVTITVRDDPHVIRGAGDPRVMVDALVLEVGQRAVPRAAVTLVGSAEHWLSVTPGARVRATATVSRPRQRDLSVATISAGAPQVISQGSVVWRATAAIRLRFAEAADRGLPEGQSGLLPALVLGDVSGLDPLIADDFRACGMTHLVAVSGANFVLLCGSVVLVAQLLGASRRVTDLVALGAILGLVVLVHPSPSVVRAAVMGVVGVLALSVSRRKQALPALGAAVLLLLAWQPGLAVDIGFALSVAATAGLIVAATPVREALRRRHVPRVFADILAVSLVAHLVTLPLIAMISGRVGVMGLLANILVAPAVAPVTVIGMVALVPSALAIGALAPAMGVADVVSRFAGPELWWMTTVAHVGARVPGVTFAVRDGGLGALALIAAGLSAAAVGLGWRLLAPARVASRERQSRSRAGSAPHPGVSGGVRSLWHDVVRGRLLRIASAARRRRVSRRARGLRHHRRGP